MKLTIPFTTAALVLLLTQPAHAVLREARSFAEVAPEVQAGDATLLVLDLDNTVIEANQELGSDPWFDRLVASFQAQGAPAAEATQRAIGLWEEVNAVTGVHAVEPGTPGYLASAQEHGVAILGLTARPADFGDRTREQLASVGVDLARTAPAVGQFEVSSGIRFDRGIEFVTAQDKGEALVKFLVQVGVRPRKIIFVDDKLRNVQSVEAALERTGVEHVSFRYGAADADVRAYDPAIAEVQARVFFTEGRLLDNSAAGRIARQGVNLIDAP